MGELTVKDLYNICERQMLKGNGDKVVLVSDDDEGNDYHALYSGMCYDNDVLNKLIDCKVIRGYSADDIMIVE